MTSLIQEMIRRPEYITTEKSILEARFVGKMNIFEVVRTVAQFMVSKELLTEDDISDVLRLCDPDNGERRAGARRYGDRAVPVS